jgi:hypothetical protein
MRSALICIAAIGTTLPAHASLPAGVALDTDVAGTAATVHLTLDDVASVDLVGDDDNVAFTVDLAALLGAPPASVVRIESIGWNIALETVDPSWLLDASVAFDDADAPFPADPDAFSLAPGFTDAFSGAGTYVQPLITLSSVGLADLVLDRGMLLVEFFETFEDHPDAPDALWSGVITFGVIRTVPAPASGPVLALMLVAASRRRHRSV